MDLPVDKMKGNKQKATKEAVSSDHTWKMCKRKNHRKVRKDRWKRRWRHYSSDSDTSSNTDPDSYTSDSDSDSNSFSSYDTRNSSEDDRVRKKKKSSIRNKHRHTKRWRDKRREKRHGRKVKRLRWKYKRYGFLIHWPRNMKCSLMSYIQN